MTTPSNSGYNNPQAIKDKLELWKSTGKYPSYMTGKRLRTMMGLPEKPRIICNKTFRLAARFRSVQKEHRLKFLIREANKDTGISLSFIEMKAMRDGFDQHKVDHLPMSEQCICYCCDKQATLRHHVIPISKGGRNKRTNIVPLCHDCHAKIHPFMND